ncbi:hypothetical protein BDDG_09129 [Blastomyces dermatitidis ATCC 18188]|uniref:Uncharacterized protein n=1 Tax=Ajellomyces dermatitidis (strain ATCC 18188 / CBS 674.68) TaxID=653446 RepID=F2TSH1_AJEDA|nr:hypothetical protein BDDG_09129 [Blastomyces dermatitidis ATCC 18188]
MKTTRSLARFSLLYFLCAAIGTLAAPVDPEQFPRLQSSIARRSVESLLFRIYAETPYGFPLYARVDKPVPGELRVAMDPDPYRATPAEITNGTVGFKPGGNETLFLSWESNPYTPSVLFSTLSGTGGITGVNRDNSTGLLTWSEATQNPVGWMICLMVDEIFRLWYSDDMYIGPPLDCFFVSLYAEIIGEKRRRFRS